MRKKLKIKSNKMFLKSKINSKNSKYKSLKTARDINMHIKELKRNIKQESNVNFENSQAFGKTERFLQKS